MARLTRLIRRQTLRSQVSEQRLQITCLLDTMAAVCAAAGMPCPPETDATALP